MRPFSDVLSTSHDPAAALPAQGSLFGEGDAFGYGTGPVYDEMVTGAGRLRPHWQAFMSTLGPLDPATMAERWEEARRLLHQNGVTYNIYGDPQGMERPWPLDMMPLLIAPEEWQVIEAGLVQRARVLNAALADLYGPQRLLREGVVPPAAIYADPGFRRAVHGIVPPRGIHLHFYAADLARAPDGTWWVLSDRTQAPSGSGYALENRTVLARVLPDSLRYCRVERLTPFFGAFKEMLLGLAPWSDQPRLVLLTPGPYNETYFEHVYLARQLGITLVEGADLTVRDRQVYLKTLSGLEPVDVILRRLDGEYADPLELRADSSLGVAGLVEAARAGRVAIANALGSGVLESLSFRACLPAIAGALLGETLAMPQLPTWWAATPDGRGRILANLGRLMVVPASPSLPFAPMEGAGLSEAARADLAGRVAATPWAYAAHERPSLSTVPVWQGDRLQPRPLVLRVFLCADADGGYRAMPGGLTRVSDAPGRLIVSMQQGSGSKDTWVLAPRPVGGGSALARAAVAEVRAQEGRAFTGDLPSRVADSLFWLGRYAERSEGALRLLRGVYTRITDGGQPGATEELRVLLKLMAWLGKIPWELTVVGDGGGGPALRAALQAAVFDGNHPNSLRADIQRLHRSAYSVRDRLSIDMWRVITQIDRQSPGPRGRIDAAALLLRLDDLVTSLAALSGLEQESMTRGPGWRFLDIGRRVERALHGVALVRGVHVADSGRMDRADLAAALDVLLELAESFMSYRERHFAAMRPGPVLALLLADETNPRGLAFQLAVLERHLARLPRMPEGQTENPMAVAARIVGDARAMVAEPGALEPPSLHNTLDWLSLNLPELSNLLAHAYFSHAFARPA
ncbi:circularly permuted type 2 ATP-grasp protein [Azospirillum halopraeferens]|uniref:circularly permuted type 2 ATP-grasp protein n=1 Tax=Azospirillum halopraeferens TaxID=34010 RepID=UPI0003F54656|nr:circularly permuted type 2 ATP-grasp protein [Azospirillum halopraeferens]